jgi:NAD(P)-dependent dehydrogenase (short-subunit alcohol dehydrogenase family)
LFPDTALVTGGASGIGRAIVERLEREGTDVRVLDLADGFDVSDASAWDSVGTVQLACLNAGVGTGEEDVSELTDERYRRILGTNVDGVVFGVRRLARVMPEGGAIVVTASLAGLTTMVLDPIYAGTKHFVIGFVRSIRDRLATTQIEMLRPEEIADAVLTAARDGSTGEAWTCLPGRPPERFVFHRFFDSA